MAIAMFLSGSVIEQAAAAMCCSGGPKPLIEVTTSIQPLTDTEAQSVLGTTTSPYFIKTFKETLSDTNLTITEDIVTKVAEPQKAFEWPKPEEPVKKNGSEHNVDQQPTPALLRDSCFPHRTARCRPSWALLSVSAVQRVLRQSPCCMLEHVWRGRGGGWWTSSVRTGNGCKDKFLSFALQIDPAQRTTPIAIAVLAG